MGNASYLLAHLLDVGLPIMMDGREIVAGLSPTAAVTVPSRTVVIMSSLVFPALIR